MVLTGEQNYLILNSLEENLFTGDQGDWTKYSSQPVSFPGHFDKWLNPAILNCHWKCRIFSK